MNKYIFSKFFLLLIVICLLMTGCANKKNDNISKSEVYQIGVSWVDNIIDAHSKYQNSPNELSKEANLKYLIDSVNYYIETLEHATDEEKRLLDNYFSEKANNIGKDTKYFLNFGGDK